MRDLLTVLKFEFMGFMKKKSFVISTIILLLILAIGLSIPTIKDTFFSSNEEENSVEEGSSTNENKNVYGYIDENGEISNVEVLKENFYVGKLKEVESVSELKDKVNSGDFVAGFIVEGETKYQYVVKNNEILGPDQMGFENALIRAYRIKGFEEKGIEYSEVEGLINPYIESETTILGKDSAKNYLYTYILVFGLYFMIIFYGQLIATSVASEKSNRTMEVLITSTKSSNLIFGKVLGGALAGALQFGLIIATGMIAYNLNAEAWNNKLDFIFDIPSDVLLIFSIFGILGYLFYSFIYGALGALVSRTEDVSASATPITILFIGVFFIAMTGMQNTEGIVLKIASFVPFSSFMAMFVRVSMGSVTNLEVAISLILLVLSTGLIGFIGAKIYRMGTLMYGNPVKLKDAIKILRSE